MTLRASGFRFAQCGVSAGTLTKPIPLTACLGIKTNLIIVANQIWFQIEKLVDNCISIMTWVFNSLERPTIRCRQPLSYQLGFVVTNLSDTETPVWISFFACRVFSGVSRFKLPIWSFTPSVSQIPQAHPGGIPGTGGRSAYFGILDIEPDLCTVILF